MMKNFLEKNKNQFIFLIAGLLAASTFYFSEKERQYFPINLMPNPGIEENLQGWCTGNDASGTTSPSAAIIDCSGTPAGLSNGRYTGDTYRLTGNASLTIVKDSGDAQGDYSLSPVMFVPDSLRGQPLDISFSNKENPDANGFSYTDENLKVYAVAWDTDSSDAILLQVPRVLDSSGFYSSQIQTNKKFIRLMFYVATTETDQWGVIADDFLVKLQNEIFLANVSDLEPVTVTGSWTSNTTYSAMMAQQGEFAYIRYKLTLTGAPTSTTLTLNLPNNLQIDSSKFPSTFADYTILEGGGRALDQGTQSYLVYGSYHSGDGLGKIRVLWGPNYGVVTQSAPFTWANTDTLELWVKVPIQGWTGGNKTRAQILQNVPVSFEAYKNAGSVGANANVGTWTSVIKDSTGSFNSSTGAFTVPSFGDYSGVVQLNISSGAGTFYIYVDGVSTNWKLYIDSGVTTRGHIPFQLKNLRQGQVVSLFSDTSRNFASSNDTRWVMTKDIDSNTLLAINRTTTKYLASNLSVSTSDIANLKANGTLTVGKMYQVTLHASVQTNAATVASDLIVYNGANIVARHFVVGSSGTRGDKHSTKGPKFIATSSSLQTDWAVSGSGGTLYGNGTAGETYIEIEEINNTVEGNF